MVVLGAHDTPLPGRYWGEGQGPVASPSQASLLLARLNERARERKAGVGKGTQRDKQGKPGVEQGGVVIQVDTPKHKLTTDQDRSPWEQNKEGIAILPTDQHHSTPPPLIQPSGDAKPKVNGARVEEPWTEQVESPRKKKKKIKDGEEAVCPKALEILSGENEGLGSQQDEAGGDGPCVKKKKKKRKREEEEVEAVADQRDTSVSLQDDGSEAPVIKKKKKKRKREEEELVRGEEVESLKSVISGAVEGTEESSSIKKKKKKKKHEKFINEEETGVSEDDSVGKENDKYSHEDVEKDANDERGESACERPENERKKKRRKRGEEVVEEVEDAQAEQVNGKQQENDDTLTSLIKKESKKGIKLEPKEDESQTEISRVPKIKIKEEIVDTAEDLEQKEEERREDNHIGGGGGDEETGGIGGQDTKKGKKKEKKKKTKKKEKTKEKEKKGKSREVGGFTLLTEVEATKRQKVHRTLPHWLANPTVIGRDLMADGAPVDSLTVLDQSLKDHLKQQKIMQLFPVQRAVIPEILAGAGTLACRFQPRDVCVSAPTGSGKTLAYVLPIVQALKSRTVPRIRALVLLPVQELATQVFHVFQTYCRGTSLRVGKAVGHSTLQKEQAALVAHHLNCHHSLIDILVATPGRLADHLRMTKGLDLSALRYLVLDEADRMLAAEGGDWVAHVQRAITSHRAAWDNQPLPQPPLQRLLFSATLSSDPEQLQHVALYHPKLYTVAAPVAGQDKSVAVVIGQYVRPAELREEYVVVEEEVKPLALHHLLVSGEGRHRVLIFTNSVQATHKLALLLSALSQGSSRVVAEFSSKRDKRQQILSQFASGKIDVLVSSDAMARGLDIPNIDHVVSYDVTATTTYVHRIGRTARAGRPGTALSLVTKSTMSEFRRALSGGGEGACQLSLTPEELEPYEQQYIDALASLKAALEEEERERRQNRSTGKAKKKKKQKKRQRKQKKDMRTARLTQKKSIENKGKVSFKANPIRRHLKRP